MSRGPMKGDRRNALAPVTPTEPLSVWGYFGDEGEGEKEEGRSEGRSVWMGLWWSGKQGLKVDRRK